MVDAALAHVQLYPAVSCMQDNPFACPACGANMIKIGLDAYRCTRSSCRKMWTLKDAGHALDSPGICAALGTGHLLAVCALLTYGGSWLDLVVAMNAGYLVMLWSRCIYLALTEGGHLGDEGGA
jgi:hypothetical protein